MKRVKVTVFGVGQVAEGILWCELCPSAVTGEPAQTDTDHSRAKPAQETAANAPTRQSWLQNFHSHPLGSATPPQNLPCVTGEQRRAVLRVSTLTPFLHWDGSWKEDEQQNTS